MTTPLIEAIARSIAAVKTWDGDTFAHNRTREELSDAAQAALTAITEAGYVVLERVPVPTGMDESLCRAQFASVDEVILRISAAQGGGE